MAASNADHVFSQIVTIAKSQAGEIELRRRATQRIDQFTADVARSPHPQEISDRNRCRLCEMLRLTATSHTLPPKEKAVFVEALARLSASEDSPTTSCLAAVAS
jgi:hypothetical protein